MAWTPSCPISKMNQNCEDHVEIIKGKNTPGGVELDYNPGLPELTWVGLWCKGAGLGIGLGAAGGVVGWRWAPAGLVLTLGRVRERLVSGPSNRQVGWLKDFWPNIV
jgi:hypothetical protein